MTTACCGETSAEHVQQFSTELNDIPICPPIRWMKLARPQHKSFDVIHAKLITVVARSGLVRKLLGFHKESQHVVDNLLPRCPAV